MIRDRRSISGIGDRSKRSRTSHRFGSRSDAASGDATLDALPLCSHRFPSVGAVPGKGQPVSQNKRKGLQNQGVSGREQIEFLPIFERRPAQQSQTIASFQQLLPEAGNLSLPVAAEVPHVGMVRVVAPSFTQPGVSRFQNILIEDVVEGDVHPLGILAANPDKSREDLWRQN